MRLLLVRFILVCFSVALAACRESGSEKLFRKIDPEESGVRFANNLQYYDSLTVLEFEYMFNGGGVSLIDVNNDGLQDILMGGNMVPTRLYLNKGALRFEDITGKAGIKTKGWCYGISVVDINQDGFYDFYVCKAGNRRTPPSEMRNEFYINNGNNTFTEAAGKMGLDEDGYDIHSAFLDYDGDGDLDMYLLRNAFVNYNRNNSRPKELSGKAASTDKLFRNNGNGTFTNVSAEAGIVIEGFGLGVNVCDLNEDNWPDIYVSNDFLTNDLVWINNRNGTFTNKAADYLRHQTYNAMGNDVADFNNDGLPDIVVVDMLPPDNKRWKLTMAGNTYDEFQQNIAHKYEPQYVRNTLQLNNGNGTFSEIGRLAGIEATEWSWAPLFADFDNDGWKDLFISNGYRQDVTNLDFIMYGKKALFMGTAEANRKERLDELNRLPGINVHDYIFKNEGNLTFKDMSAEWGMTEPGFSNGAVYGDLDNDGDLDIVVNNLDQPSVIYENRSNKLKTDRSYLRVKFDGPAGNRHGLGARVWIWQKGAMQYNFFSPFRGYLSSVEQLLHFGVGNGVVDSLKVLWPGGKQQMLYNIPAGKIVSLKISDAEVAPEIETKTAPGFFEQLDKTGVSYVHEEDEFVDFKVQPILPHMHSRQGPANAVADVNLDGLEDFYIGAATGGRARIFIQQKDNSFSQEVFPDSNLADNMGALFFDADNDGDADLYVASGGSSGSKKEDARYAHKFYVNNGKGKFARLQKGMPDVVTPASSVIGSDYDRDGDIDLFVCGRVSPGEYPYPSRSYLLRNDSRNNECAFTDATSSVAPQLVSPGMVTSALWTDFNNDGWADLIIAGEFMPIRFFQNSKGRLEEITELTGIQHSSGWWNSITGADFDKDGDIDYVAGNLGLNGPYEASAEYPVCVYASDFDKNGRMDPVLCHYLNKKEYTVHARDDMVKQMTSMRGRFRTYEKYASVTFREGFREDELEGAFVLKAERFENSYIENLGAGKFKLHSLPNEAQFAPIYGMLTGDFNNDGNIDVLGVGNSFSTEVQTGRYDARGSILLFGDGKGGFAALAGGLSDNGDNKSLSGVRLSSGDVAFLVGSNSGDLKVFKQTQASLLFTFLPGETYFIATDNKGKQYRQEFYYGHSYLSQNGRTIFLPSGTEYVTVYSNSGQKRIVRF
jgi:enediyne biosynthesis protein E4